MSVPFLDVGAAYHELQLDIDAAVSRVLTSGWYVLGAEVLRFEREWAEYCGSAHAVGLSNGLDALKLALLALGVGAGDEVIVPSNTYVATWLAVTQVGAIPVPVEPDEDTFNLTPGGVAAAISPRTKSVLYVALYGQPVDVDGLREATKDRGISLLEDAAQAHGARYRGRRVGALADITAWSFYPGKNLGALGDAGAVTTDDAELADRVSVLRNYGSRQKYFNEVPGYNARLDEIQAAVLTAKLPYLESWNARRREIARRYGAALAGMELILPAVPEWADPAWHLYVVRTARRDALQASLASAGIGTLVHYPLPPHRQRAYLDLGFATDAFPIASRLADQVLSLPMGPHLAEAGFDNVVKAVQRFADA